MGMAGPIFEPHPQNFGKLFIFYRWTNDITTISLYFLPKIGKSRKTDFSLYSRPLTVENPSNSTVSGLELREKIGFSKFSHFWLEI